MTLWEKEPISETKGMQFMFASATAALKDRDFAEFDVLPEESRKYPS